jgi:hypothetical protein
MDDVRSIERKQYSEQTPADLINLLYWGSRDTWKEIFEELEARGADLKGEAKKYADQMIKWAEVERDRQYVEADKRARSERFRADERTCDKRDMANAFYHEVCRGRDRRDRDAGCPSEGIHSRPLQRWSKQDREGRWSRRFYDLVVRHVGDLGGRDLLSEAQLSLIRRAASIECELERLDAMLSQGAPVDLTEYGRAASHLRRLFETIGLKRVSRDVTPTLAEIAAEIEAERCEGVT